MEKHQRLQWYFERAQRELIKEKRYDASKRDATYAKVHDLRIKNYKTFMTMKYEMQLKPTNTQPYAPTHGFSNGWSAQYRDTPYQQPTQQQQQPRTDRPRLTAQQFMSNVQKQQQYYQQLAGGDEKQNNQYVNNPSTVEQLAQAINQNFGQQLLPPRDHVGIMPAETTGQVQIPAPPDTTVQNRYPTAGQTHANSVAQNLTPAQAQTLNQQLSNLGVTVPQPNLLSNLPAEANTS